jgi:predicted metal-dependent enzyme (double-stranded beta helix superfamily)
MLFEADANLHRTSLLVRRFPDMIQNLSDPQHQQDAPLARFIESVHEIVSREAGVREIAASIAARMGELLVGWRMRDERYLERQPGCRYGSYLLYRAPDFSFVVVIDTFDAGQRTQIHNHRTWAVVGLLDGAERNEIFRAPNEFAGAPQRVGESITRPGEVVTMMETDMHRLQTDQGQCSRSLHVYGADVGTIRRVRWDEQSERYVEFQQGWSNDAVGLPVYFDCAALTELEIRRSCLGYL